MGYDSKGRWIFLTSLILKGIDLPSKDKSPLVITVWADGVVCSVDSNGGIEETTSAIQIPKGHGRLIDRDKVLKGLEEDTREAFTKHDVWLMLSKYNANAPTILEAENSDG